MATHSQFGITPQEIGRSEGLRTCVFSGLFFKFASVARFRSICLKLALRLEGYHFFSATARAILARDCGVRIGAYTYGECFNPGAWPRNVTVGRYASIGPGVRIFLRHHPLDRLSMHSFFYNSKLGYVQKDNIPEGRLVIDHDCWIGERAIITSKCSRIGIGAVVGAGAVVTKDVPDFAVAVGNPAKVLKYRFSSDVQEKILASRWWEKSVDELAAFLPELTIPLLEQMDHHPLLSTSGFDIPLHSQTSFRKH